MSDHNFVPAFCKLSDKELGEIESAVYAKLDSCDLCSRKCRIDRRIKTGWCRGGMLAKVSSYGPHFGEEAVLVGRYGSGTIFFAGCNLGCCFCQNYDISHLDYGREVSPRTLADMMLELQAEGCHNINLVTPSHFVAQIVGAIRIAARDGLHLPIVYNCGGYESIETLGLLQGIVDIYMPDFKFASKASSERYLKAPDYPEVCMASIREMHRQVGDLLIEDGLARRGLLVRHLLMPGHLDDSVKVFKFIAEEISPNTFINIMDQYRPCFKASEFSEIDRRISIDEFQAAIEAAERVGLRRIYY